MTDHKEEQELELEALNSIYPDEFSLIESDPCCFQVSIASEPEKQEDQDCRVCATLQFTYIDTYPDDAPVIDVPSYEGLDNSDADDLREYLEQEENLGMAMVFTLVSAAQEKLIELMDKLKTQKEDEKLRKEKRSRGGRESRQLFEQDESMENSDAAFLESEVKVDESLFQEMDDLDLDDEDIE
ncbi:RWD domain-containing protein 1 [Desmophyllum pertusum]|uniref:RWD domain-containing protein 1 n=1 Tax=Desmophyllum pertusum TaxID=174260 RepID=A0A9X0A4C1_9CNID|nr:RWD domain-containing protein 1 [Desmophyllum pertusum]